MPDIFDRVEKWVDDKKTSASRTVTKWTDDIGGLEGAAPRPSVRDPAIAKSKDVNLRTRASHKTDEEILRKVDNAARKMVQGSGGIVGAKASVLARPHHTDSWGAVGKEASNYGRSFVRGIAYSNELNARGLQSPPQSNREQWGDLGDNFSRGAVRGFSRGLGSPPQASVVPQTRTQNWSAPDWMSNQ